MGVPTKTAAAYLNDSLMQSDSDLHALEQEQACAGVGLTALKAIASVETAIKNREALEFMRLQLYRATRGVQGIRNRCCNQAFTLKTPSREGQ
jgi:hypothetical protein